MVAAERSAGAALRGVKMAGRQQQFIGFAFSVRDLERIIDLPRDHRIVKIDYTFPHSPPGITIIVEGPGGMMVPTRSTVYYEDYERWRRDGVDEMREASLKEMGALRMVVEDAVIRLPSLFKPNEPTIIEGQSYKGCIIAGPANVLFDGNLTTNGNLHMDACDFVVLAEGMIPVNTAAMFRDCTFTDCRFERVCFLLSPGMAAQMVQPGVNWLTKPPEIPATLPTQPVEGTTVQ